MGFNQSNKGAADSSKYPPASQIFLSLAKFFLAAALFSVLVVLDGTLFPFTEGKYYFFRLCVESALACTGLSWCCESKPGDLAIRFHALTKRPLFLSVCAFTGVFLLSSFFAVERGIAFWSTLERGDGAFQMLHYAAFYVLLLLVLRDQKDWHRMLVAAVSAAVLVIVYGVVSADILPNPEPLPVTSSFNLQTPDALLTAKATGNLTTTLFSGCRFEGSLGNSDYAGPYLLFALFFLCALQFLPGKTMLSPASELSEGSGSLPSQTRALNKGSVRNLVVAFLFLLFLILSDSRGAFLGLVCAAACAVFYLCLRRPRWRRYLLSAAALIVVVYAGASNAFHQPGVSAVPGSRILVFSLTDESAKSRLRSWHAAWQGFLERPLLGWGAENFSTVFDRHFDTAQFQPGNQFCQTWQDRAHNVFLDYLVETGLIGLIAFLSIFATLALALKEALTHKKTDVPLSKQSILLQASVIAIVVAYLVQGMFLFDVLPSYISLFLTLAFLTGQLYPPVPGLIEAGVAEQLVHQEVGMRPQLLMRRRNFVTAAMVFGLVITAFYGTFLPMAKSFAYMSMRGKLDGIRTWQDFTASVKKPLDMPSPVGNAELLQNFVWTLAIPIAQTTNQDARILPNLMDMIDSYEDPLLTDKNSPARCQHLYLMAALNKAAFVGSKEPKYLDTAQNFCEEGLSLSPNRPEFLYGLYDIYKLRGDVAKQARQARLIASIWPKGMPTDLAGGEAKGLPAQRREEQR